MIKIKNSKFYKILSNYKNHRILDENMFSSVDLEINTMCNRKCNYCPNAYSKRPLGFMDENIFKKVILELGKLNYSGCINYNFYGEPLLDKRLENFIRYSKKHLSKAKNVIFSNADFLTYEKLTKLMKAGTDSFIFTMHDGQMSEKFKEIYDRCNENQKKKIQIWYPKTINLHNRAGYCPDYGSNDPKIKNKPCPRPSYNLIITYNGNVLPCCDDYYEKQVFGNVNDKSLRKIWVSKEYRKFRKDLSLGKRQNYELCKNCNYNGK